MNNKKYLDDLKNLKPLPPDRIPVGSSQSSARSQEIKPINIPDSFNRQSSIDNRQLKPIQHSKTEVRKLETLNNSKTLWGFGIALFIYIVQNILAAAGIAGPDNLLIKTAIEVIIAIAGFFGVYGIRDALRKIRSDL